MLLAESSDWVQWLAPNPLFWAAVIAVGCTVSYQWRMVYKEQAEAKLKSDMLERGMSAEEIERVMNS